MKRFVEFSFDDQNYKLEIYAYMLERGEVDKLIKSLENKKFKLSFIDNDSIRGELELAQYPEIVKVRKQLEKEGFTWSGEEDIRIKVKLPEKE